MHDDDGNDDDDDDDDDKCFNMISLNLDEN